MQVRTYRARSLQEALAKVHAELGPDTSVVQTRELDIPWWERLSRGRHFEIRTTDSDRDARPSPLPLRRVVDIERTSPGPLATEPSAAVSSELEDRLPNHFIEPRSVPPTPGRNDNNPALFEVLTALIEADVPESEARSLIELLRSSPGAATLEQLSALARQRLLDELPASRTIQREPGSRRVVALVGPTGVGKTTTIAKLAANFRLRERLRVGMVTVDTYRIAAVEQLRTYANMMDLPMAVATTPREMREAVSQLSDFDVVLIDTAGRSPHDVVQLQQLKSVLGQASVDEVHLVMSAVASSSHLVQTYRKFEPIGINSLLITKLDEAAAVGNLISVLRAAQLPVSYLTCGQSVPDDIVDASTERLVPVMLGQEPLASLV